MKIDKFNSYKPCLNNQKSFKAINLQKQTLFDLFVKTPFGHYNPKQSLKKISGIEPQYLGGTKCKGSIPLKNFWDFFDKKSKNIKNLGYSTNKDGYGNCFLKSNSSMPISTSFVHNCSVMYLYNKNTQTHALYHALSDCSEETLKYILRTLMPEGFTRGAIIPGDSIFYAEHSANMKKMLKLMKQFCPKALVNVYHSTLKYPEIVGKAGNVYQIPNRKVQNQIKLGNLDPNDYGQATFRIIDLQGYNTFEQIFFAGNTVEQLEELKRTFMKKKYPKMVMKILYQEIEKRKKSLEKIENINNDVDFQKIKSQYLQKNMQKPLIIKQEELLIEELKKIKFVDDLRNFFHKVRFDLVKMDKLLDFFQKKKNEILK